MQAAVPCVPTLGRLQAACNDRIQLLQGRLYECRPYQLYPRLKAVFRLGGYA